MKVLTLWQPWATLVVIGAKGIETRGYNTKFEGTVLIHASKKPVDEIWREEYFRDVLNGQWPLPLGMIIGRVDIGGSFKTEEAEEYFSGERYFGNHKTYDVKSKWGRDKKREIAFGDYSPGRYGWELHKPVEFKHYTPFSGGVGFTKSFNDKICLVCGCTEDNCRMCIEKTGEPCHWINKHLCSACKQ